MKNSKYGFIGAISIVIANVVGTGVFTSIGFQLEDLKQSSTIIILWVLGGIIALMGSFCYAELSAAFPRSGGEYHFLRLSFGDLTGFLSGWTSALMGFAAPMAAAAFAFSSYCNQVISVSFSAEWFGVAILLSITGIQLLKMQIGERFQVLFTVGKVLLMLVFIVIGFWWPTNEGSILGNSESNIEWSEMLTPAFWIALIYVSYSYSGWNATSYIIDDIDKPEKNVPRSIMMGTIFVVVLYVGINYVFMKVAPTSALKGKEEVAHIASAYLFGEHGAKWISIIIAFFLISSISSMAIIGPRVIKRMADDYPQFSFLSVNNKNGVPVRAVLVQLLVSVLLLLTSSFSFIVTATGFLLTIFTTLTVVGLMVLRKTRPDVERRIKVPFYPVLPILFIIFNLFIILFMIPQKPAEAIAAILFLLLGILAFYAFRLKTKQEKQS